jgi:S1-C subfamily serine protease
MNSPRNSIALWAFVLTQVPGVAAAQEVAVLPDQLTLGPATAFERLPANLADSITDTGAGSLSSEFLQKTLAGLKPQHANLIRGGREAQIFARYSPAVVFIGSSVGTGSGVLVSEDGKIVTNAHVVGKDATVLLAFKPTQEGGSVSTANLQIAQVVKVDPVKDLALLKTLRVPSGVRPVEFGSIKDLAVGADVHAIGHPLGESWSYTKGYVSQIRPDYDWRSQDGQNHVAHVIQTQTPISPGNSGGPLLSDGGALMGINSFGMKNAQNINYAVSVDDVRSFLDGSGGAVNRKRCRPIPGEARETKLGAVPGKIAAVDLNCDGKMSARLFVPNDSGPIRMFVFLPDGGQMVLYDYERSGKWSKSLFYTKDGTEPVAIGSHPDGEAMPSGIKPFKGS